MTDGGDDPDGAGAPVRRIRAELEGGRTLYLQCGEQPSADDARALRGIALNFLTALHDETGDPDIARAAAALVRPRGGRPPKDDSSPLAEAVAIYRSGRTKSAHEARMIVASALAVTERGVMTIAERLRRKWPISEK